MFQLMSKSRQRRECTVF